MKAALTKARCCERAGRAVISQPLLNCNEALVDPGFLLTYDLHNKTGTGGTFVVLELFISEGCWASRAFKPSLYSFETTDEHHRGMRGRAVSIGYAGHRKGICGWS